MTYNPTAIWYTASTIAQCVAALLAFGAFMAQWRRGEVLRSGRVWLDELRSLVDELVHEEMADPHKEAPVMRPSSDQMTLVGIYLRERNPGWLFTLSVAGRDPDWLFEHSNLLELITVANNLLEEEAVIRPRIDERSRFDRLKELVTLSAPFAGLAFGVRRSLLALISFGGVSLFSSVAVLPLAKLANDHPDASAVAAVVVLASFAGTLAAGGWLVWATLVSHRG